MRALRAWSTLFFPCFYDSTFNLWVATFPEQFSKVCAIQISIFHIQSTLGYLVCFLPMDVGTNNTIKSCMFLSTKHGPTLTYHPNPDICSTWTPVLSVLWVWWWASIPAPPPPWLQNAGCPLVPAARSFPSIPAVFVLSSSWTVCSLASWTYPRHSQCAGESREVTWGWRAHDSPWLLDKSSSVLFNFLLCERGCTNSPTAKLDFIVPLKCLNVPQWELLTFPVLNISSLHLTNWAHSAANSCFPRKSDKHRSI